MISLASAQNFSFNIADKTPMDLIRALSNIYKKPSTSNNAYFNVLSAHSEDRRGYFCDTLKNST